HSAPRPCGQHQHEHDLYTPGPAPWLTQPRNDPITTIRKTMISKICAPATRRKFLQDQRRAAPVWSRHDCDSALRSLALLIVIPRTLTVAKVVSRQRERGTFVTGRFARDVVIVGGCGHAGLPLAVALADRGASVTAYDIAAEAVEAVNAGRS